jgi:CBS domain-containing protein
MNHKTMSKGCFLCSMGQENRTMKVEQLMTKEIAFCTPNWSLNEAARLMWENDCGCVPVTSGDEMNRVVGMVTDRDICMTAYFCGGTLPELHVRDAMSKEPICCRPSTTHEEAESMMRKAQVRRIPVVDDAGGLLGILSLADLVHAQRSSKRQIPKSQISDVLAAICEPDRSDAKEGQK